eukprot:SM000110S18929  [mRNA]  locus=s110:288993:291017:- [translate_table: standard]
MTPRWRARPCAAPSTLPMPSFSSGASNFGNDTPCWPLKAPAPPPGLSGPLMQPDLLGRGRDRLDGQEGSAWQSGSTAAVAFVRRDRIFVASCGDSRIVLAAGDDVHELVDDHRPAGGSDAGVAEAARIKDAGGWVSGGRVCGSLAVSRAFGDVEYKAHHRRSQAMKAGITKGRWTSRFISKLRLDEDWVVVQPSVHAAHLPPNAELVIVASDGLWDSMSSSEAVRFAKEKLAEHGDLEHVCQALVQYSLVDRKGQDNVSVALIKLS